VSFGWSVIIAELWRFEVRRPWNIFRNFCVFLEKRPLMVKFSKFCFECFHRDIDRCCSVDISLWMLPTGNCALFTRQKTKCCLLLITVATAWITPKICQDQPPTMCSQCSRFHPNRFTFGGVIAERVNTSKLPRKVNPIFGQSIASSRIINSTSLVPKGLW